MSLKTALVCGAGGFIGSHLVTRLKTEGYRVIGVDLKYPEFSKSNADSFHALDLRNQNSVETLFSKETFDEVYQLAADMGGSTYVFTGENDANILHNSCQINLNILEACKKQHLDKSIDKQIKVFFSSSACIYNSVNQLDPNDPNCKEDTAYPANPDSDYGFEKLFSERLYLAYHRNYGLPVRIARYHNIFGPEGTYTGGKEKAPAALCRKVILANKSNITENNSAEIELFGIKNTEGKLDGIQTRSFLFINECLEGTRRLMDSDFTGPVNIGSDEMISIRDLFSMIKRIENSNVGVVWREGPTGVNGRNSDNSLIYKKLKWKPNSKLENGILETYHWIKSQIN